MNMKSADYTESKMKGLYPLSLKREFLIHLDRSVPEGQDHFKVSLVTAKLPLLSPFAVTVKDKLRIERQQGRTYQVLFYSCAGPYLLFDVQVLKPKTPTVQGPSTLAICDTGTSRLFKKEIHHV